MDNGEKLSLAIRIQDLLLKWQKKQLAKDTGHGYVTTREVANAVNLDVKTCRAFLNRMAEAELVFRWEVSNGIFWRTTCLLPWEVRLPSGDFSNG
jgi:predicted transcriptional regulator of viral defense system